ncbi:chloride channel protein [Dermatobacter hominis]|uniref:chloride channel protein n=1 Tax=Dermatobacter hominis TaxID=2884263 RepID=UPI001D10CDA0|nr:chloride channel protein [Dermatobacter hominis]UDY37309.1 chloride channel protein [Dermatobacter hominis]
MRGAVVRIRQGLGPPVIAVGVAGGLLGAAYVGALHLLQRVLGPEHHSGAVQLAILTAVGGAVALITHLGGETGNVELLVDNIHVLGGAEDVTALRSLIPASLLCVSAGAGMGPEAPLVQSTGTIGTVVGTGLGRTRADVRILTITGMAAGFTVLFGAPLGSAIFALEILHRRGLQYYEALLPAVVGSLCGYAVYLGLSGLGVEPVWRFPTVGTLHVGDLAVAVVIGALGAAGAALFAATTRALRWTVARVPVAGRYVLGGVVLGLLGWWSPYALTFGEGQLGELLDARLAGGALAVAVVAKLLGTTVTLAAGWKGGFIIPLFFMGAAAGQLAHQAVPAVNPSVLMACAMVALCVGVTKTPIGTTLVVTEMAGLPLLPVLLVAAVAAMLTSPGVTLIETQRERDAVPASVG